MNPNNPELKSFIEVDKESHFPIQNLPFGAFTFSGSKEQHLGVAIGNFVLDLTELEKRGQTNFSQKQLFQEETLNLFMAQGSDSWSRVRGFCSEILRDDNPKLRDNLELRQHCLYKQEDVKMQLPVVIGDYTDFYSSIEHASNVGAMFRDKDNPLLPNWRHLPVGYHGRASSIITDSCPIRRPMGQVKNSPAADSVPEFLPCQKLDFELETAFIVGKESKLGQALSLSEAEKHIFGLVLMNDWSARDIQKWEYVPLGPFVSKSFATSISPWIVTMEALRPFRVKGPKQEPRPLAYLSTDHPELSHFDINLEVFISLKGSSSFEKIATTSSKNLYWSMAQQLVHHTVTGCNVKSRPYGFRHYQWQRAGLVW